MKAVLILAFAVFAVPALAQNDAAPRNAVNLGVPNCVSTGACPSLRATIVRQLGVSAPATPAVGGPFEPAAAPAAAPAAMPARTVGEYPPCHRGRTQDRCIQLYERDVHR